MKKKYTFGHLLLVVIFLLLSVAPLDGQGAPTREEQRSPSLQAVVDGKEQPLKLSRLDVEVDISGKLAETRITMTFKNPYARRLEGQLVFPLPEGAFVSGYALDINGKMVDGVVVEKQKARVVFEKIVRQDIDPGLVEWVKGNNFRTRVYPIEPNKTRSVMVRYVSQLDFKKGTYGYRLPLNYKQRVSEFLLRTSVSGANPPTVFDKKEKEGFKGLDFKLKKGIHMAQFSRKNYLLDNDFVISVLPRGAHAASAVANTSPGVEGAVMVERNPDGGYYFCIHDTKGAEEYKRNNGKNPPKHKELPDRITILWDASGSRARKGRQKELDLLKAYFNNPRFKNKTVEVLLHFFRNRKGPALPFPVVSGNIDKIVEAVLAVDYDGGTTIGAIAPQKGEKTPDFYLMFSDGNHNIGDREPTGFKAPLYIASSSADADFSFLHYLALKTGGIYFNLNRGDTADVIDSIGSTAYTFISASVSKGSIKQIQPSGRKQVRGNFLLSGILKSKKAVVTLNYGKGNNILQRVSFRVTRKQAVTGNIIRTFWAQEKVRALSLFPKINKKELVKTGKAYGLVTPGTSLIVLESLDQYIQYRITPPKSLPKMRATYKKQTALEKKEVKDGKEKKLEQILELWKERVEWWKKDFTKKPKPRKKTADMRPRVRAISGSSGRYSTRHTGNDIGTGGIRGKVLLEDNSEIPGVLVTITSPVLSGRQSTISHEYGDYSFNSLPPGMYELRAELAGFKTFAVKDIRVMAGRRFEFDIEMRLGCIREEVVVCTASSTIGRRESNASAESTNAGPGIRMSPWNPDTPYMKQIKKAPSHGEGVPSHGEGVPPRGEGTPPRGEDVPSLDTAFARYMEQKKQYGDSPGFFLDCADYFHSMNHRSMALQVLSNIAEIQLEDVAFMRILGHRLLQWEYFILAEEVFEGILELRPEEPQSYRDAALAAAARGKYKRAVKLLYQVVVGDWEEGCSDIELIALMEINGIIAKVPRAASDIDRRLRKNLAVDLRVVLTWDSDMTDMDLWVTDPEGEKADYGNPLTERGGHMSDDNTSGYGPEEFILRKAIPGKYKIEVEYYGSDKPLPGPITLQVDVFTDYGRKNEKKKSITVRLEKEEEMIAVGDIEF
ncbi:MAG: DUF2135 domain-containing protein [bacterium]|nr:DUF2135 domain-containing protein [bacterium]